VEELVGSVRGSQEAVQWAGQQEGPQGYELGPRRTIDGPVAGAVGLLRPQTRPQGAVGGAVRAGEHWGQGPVEPGADSQFGRVVAPRDWLDASDVNRRSTDCTGCTGLTDHTCTSARKDREGLERSTRCTIAGRVH
jgi:hypothetical protein